MLLGLLRLNHAAGEALSGKLSGKLYYYFHNGGWLFLFFLIDFIDFIGISKCFKMIL